MREVVVGPRGAEFNGSVWANLAKAFVYVVKELGFPVVVCTALWFDLRPQLAELVLTQRKILEVQSALAVRKCIPTGQEWIPSPQSFRGGKNPPACYGVVGGGDLRLELGVEEAVRERIGW